MLYDHYDHYDLSDFMRTSVLHHYKCKDDMKKILHDLHDGAICIKGEI